MAQLESPPRQYLAAANGGRPPLKIGLTPLIDVVFILIIFFMLASSFDQWRSVTLDAPKAGSGASFEGTFLVDIHPDTIRMAGQTITMEQLAARVAQRVAEKPDQRILVKPVGDIRVQRLVGIVDAIAVAGAKNVSLVQRPDK